MKRVNFESKRIQEDYQFLMKTREQEKAIVKDCESLILAKKNENAELWNELKLANLETQKKKQVRDQTSQTGTEFGPEAFQNLKNLHQENDAALRSQLDLAQQEINQLKSSLESLDKEKETLYKNKLNSILL